MSLVLAALGDGFGKLKSFHETFDKFFAGTVTTLFGDKDGHTGQTTIFEAFTEPVHSFFELQDGCIAALT